MAVERLGMVLDPVDDLTRALAFYRQALGLALEFSDGERFRALAAGAATIALAVGDERVASGPCASLKVDDVDAVVAKLTAAGAKLERAVEDGPHERRAALRDPAGNPLLIYGPLADQSDQAG